MELNPIRSLQCAAFASRSSADPGSLNRLNVTEITVVVRSHKFGNERNFLIGGFCISVVSKQRLALLSEQIIKTKV